MSQPKQRLAFSTLPDQPLAEFLKLQDPAFVPAKLARRQLNYVDEYVRDLPDPCRSILVEHHYIDRDHMEDHSVFYSKSLYQYANSCTRIHFFSLGWKEVKRAFAELRERAAHETDYDSKCLEFSIRNYLGFAVIKPLPGCPLGRTVLRPFPQDKDNTYLRQFDCACVYEAHVLGIRLTVKGLAFQQQDLGVSACATTALWTALQRAGELEPSSVATPAQITMRASRYQVPFGRVMPSEGLSLDQMCEAIRSFGFSPNLFRHTDHHTSRALLYSALLSGISPVLVVNTPAGRHAVAAVGMKMRKRHRKNLLVEATDDLAGDMVALYVHDDRFGPYLRAEIRERKGALLLHVPLRLEPNDEEWELSHILIPMHGKIRLSFGELRRAAVDLVNIVHACRESVLAERTVDTQFQAWIPRASAYMESLLMGTPAFPPRSVERLCQRIPLSRYLGVIRLTADDLDPTDVLLDTTSTERNLYHLAVLPCGSTRGRSRDLAEILSKTLGCPTILAPEGLSESR